MVDWLSLSESSGSGYQLVSVTASPNYGGARTATLVVSGHTAFTNVEVEQEQASGYTYLTFTITSSGSIKWTTNRLDNPYNTVIEYRKNGGDWTTITASTSGTSFSVSNGDIVEFRGDNDTYFADIDGDTYSSSFKGSTARFNLSGDLVSLIRDAYLVSSYCFSYLFEETRVVDCSELRFPPMTSDWCYFDLFYGCTALTNASFVLSATTLSDGCYSSMFEGCTALTTAPELPSTTLAESCYQSMFSGCTSLTTAPDLPATELADNCYDGMFIGCTSLTTVPIILPATTLKSQCYINMFNGCTSLTTAPELPAETISYLGYASMFYRCTSLNYIKCLASDMSATNCTSSWVYGVAATGTFVKKTGVNWGSGNSGIPNGWTVQNV